MVNKDFNDNAHKYCKYAFAVNRSKGCKRITVSEIAYIEAMKDNCIIHMKDGSHHLLTCPMCTVERSLNEEDFMRIHRSFIVNIGFIALQAIPFGCMIGGPLKACVEAQAMAAQTSWQFIQEVGLNTNPETGKKEAVNVSFQFMQNGRMVQLIATYKNGKGIYEPSAIKVEDDSVEKLQTEIDYPKLRKYSQDISSQLAMAILESVMPILQSEFLDKNASEDEEAHFLVELTDKPELMQKYRAFLGRKILTAIRDKNTALINDDGTVNSKILKDCVMRTCQEELLHHAEMENLFKRTGGGLVRKQALATLEATLDETIPKILENVNLKRKRLFPSVDVTVNSESLASLPEECIHTLKFRVSPNNIKLYTEDEES